MEQLIFNFAEEPQSIIVSSFDHIKGLSTMDKAIIVRGIGYIEKMVEVLDTNKKEVADSYIELLGMRKYIYYEDGIRVK